jgi:hypothetical protein
LRSVTVPKAARATTKMATSARCIRFMPSRSLSVVNAE